MFEDALKISRKSQLTHEDIPNTMRRTPMDRMFTQIFPLPRVAGRSDGAFLGLATMGVEWM